MASRPRLVIFSYYVAPDNLVGGKRFSYLSREFQLAGHDVCVVARQLTRQDSIDTSLPEPATVVRVAPSLRMPAYGKSLWAKARYRLAERFLRAFFIDWPWIRPAMRAAARLAGSDSGVVIATSPPFAAALAATLFARKRRWPLIIDYRDPFSSYPWQHWGGVERRVGRAIEGWCVRQASAIVLNTDDMRKCFLRTFPDIDPDRIHVIQNGFDEIPHAPAGAPTIDPFAITYAGALDRDRSALPVLQALRELSRRNPAYSRVRLHVYGEMAEREVNLLKQHGLLDLVHKKPRVTKEELESILRSAALLLAISGRQMNYSIPYKVYDYLAARRPILMIAPEGSEASRFIAGNELGSSRDPGEIEAIARDLELALSGAKPVAPEESSRRFTWSSHGRSFLAVVDRCIQESN